MSRPPWLQREQSRHCLSRCSRPRLPRRPLSLKEFGPVGPLLALLVASVLECAAREGHEPLGVGP
eukprot:15099981-Alexandrium_andersonii.AAC.1